jgi:hypothetical protein
MLKKILGENIKESPEEFQEWLTALSKEQLISEMLKRKEIGAWKSEDGSEGSDAEPKQGAKVKEKDRRDFGSGDNSGRISDAGAGTEAVSDWAATPTTPAIAGNSGFVAETPALPGAVVDWG